MRAVILLALFGSAFAAPRVQNRIVGGTFTTVEEYPFMSNMQFRWFGWWWMQTCGGSLITTTAVLSAAHCYEGDIVSDWHVRLGTSLATYGGTVHDASQIILHAQYSLATLDNDVAIVKLATPAVLSSSVAVARISGANYNLIDGSVVTTIGWGTLSDGGQKAEQLQHVDVNVINQDLCAERYAHLKTFPGYSGWPDITPRMLCVGILDVGGKDACQGDSGGPVIQHGDIVVGITSWGFGCGDAFYPGVNVRVGAVVDWIVANA